MWLRRLFRRVLPYWTLALVVVHCYAYYYLHVCLWRGLNSEGELQETTVARVVLIADPQTEGDGKITRAPLTGPYDLAFNHAYMHFIYTRLFTRPRIFEPTHLIFLGDLYSSQWTSDAEFERRAMQWRRTFPVIGNEAENMPRRVNLSGNHDIGYGSEMTRAMVSRFERTFGKVNYEWSELDGRLRWAVINADNVDTSNDKGLHDETWTFLRSLEPKSSADRSRSTLMLLSHIPLHKPAGVCTDAPLMLFDRNGAVRKQNMLSQSASEYLLGKLRPAWLIAGHDHEGCDVTHFVFQQTGNDDVHKVASIRTSELSPRQLQRVKQEMADQGFPELVWQTREATVRSIMGDYDGNMGVLVIKQRQAKELGSPSTFTYQYLTCPFFHHLIARVLVIVDAVCLLIVYPAAQARLESDLSKMIKVDIDKETAAVLLRDLTTWCEQQQEEKSLRAPLTFADLYRHVLAAEDGTASANDTPKRQRSDDVLSTEPDKTAVPVSALVTVGEPQVKPPTPKKQATAVPATANHRESASASKSQQQQQQARALAPLSLPPLLPPPPPSKPNDDDFDMDFDFDIADDFSQYDRIAAAAASSIKPLATAPAPIPSKASILPQQRHPEPQPPPQQPRQPTPTREPPPSYEFDDFDFDDIDDIDLSVTLDIPPAAPAPSVPALPAQGKTSTATPPVTTSQQQQQQHNFRAFSRPQPPVQGHKANNAQQSSCPICGTRFDGSVSAEQHMQACLAFSDEDLEML
ncbi:hypothetical protein RI367_004188 [Sorochytrium milnesiophthora]